MDSRVNISLSWQGNTHYSEFGGWEIQCIDLKMKGADKNIAALLHDVPKSPCVEYPLQFILSNKEKGYYGQTVADTLTLPTVLLRTLEISVRIFQFYEDRSRGMMNSQGKISYETRGKRDNLPVIIDSFPDFEDKQNYSIKILHNADEKLTASFVKIQNQDTPVEESGPSEEAGSASSNSTQFERDMTNIFQGLSKLTVASTGGSQNEKLTQHDIPTLLTMLESKHNELKTAEQQQDNTGPNEKILAELSARQQLRVDIVHIRSELIKRNALPEEERKRMNTVPADCVIC